MIAFIPILLICLLHSVVMGNQIIYDVCLAALLSILSWRMFRGSHYCALTICILYFASMWFSPDIALSSSLIAVLLWICKERCLAVAFLFWQLCLLIFQAC